MSEIATPALHAPRRGVALAALALAGVTSASTGVLVTAGTRSLEPGAASLPPSAPHGTPALGLLVHRAPGTSSAALQTGAPQAAAAARTLSVLLGRATGQVSAPRVPALAAGAPTAPTAVPVLPAPVPVPSPSARPGTLLGIGARTPLGSAGGAVTGTQTPPLTGDKPSRLISVGGVLAPLTGVLAPVTGVRAPASVDGPAATTDRSAAQRSAQEHAQRAAQESATAAAKSAEKAAEASKAAAKAAAKAAEHAAALAKQMAKQMAKQVAKQVAKQAAAAAKTAAKASAKADHKTDHRTDHKADHQGDHQVARDAAQASTHQDRDVEPQRGNESAR